MKILKGSVLEAISAVLEVVDRISDPGRMSKEKYAEFLGCLIDDLKVRYEAVQTELGEDGD